MNILDGFVGHRASARPMSGIVRSVLLLAAAVAMGASPTLAHAQGVVAGRVVDSDSGSPIAGVTVHVRGMERGTVTDGSGEFLISGVFAGERTIDARGLGYRTATQTVAVVPSGLSGLEFALDARPIALAGIQVSVLGPDLHPHAELAAREVREANPKDSGQLLRNLDGVDAVRRGPLGLDPVVRGLRETEIGTYLDGSRLFPAGPARMDSPLTHLDPSAVQDIEVVKGPYALTWGAGNLSAIRVQSASLPAPGDERFRGSVSTGYDSNIEASEVSGRLSGRRNSISFSAHGARREGSDYEPGGDFSDLIPGDFRSSEGRGKIGFDVGDSSLLTLSGGYQDQGPVDYPGRILAADFFYSRNLSAEFETIRTEGTLRNVEVSGYVNDVSHGMNNLGKPTRNAVAMGARTPPFALDIRVDSDIQVWGGRAAVDLLSGPWTIRLGGDVYSANRNANRTIGRLTAEPLMMAMPPVGAVLFDNQLWPDATITDVGFYGRLGRTLDSGTRLSGTLRVDQVSADAGDPDAEFLEFLSRVDGSRDLDGSETNVSAAVTAGFPLNSDWELSVGLGSAVRTADATERYSDHLPATKAQTAAEFMGNPDLDPERSTQADLWLHGTYPGVAYHFNVFARQMTDFITFARTDEDKRLPLPIFPPVVYRYTNGDATFAGGEASVTLALTEVLTGELGVAYLRGEQNLFPDASGVEVQEPAFGVAPFTGRVNLRYEELGGRFFVEGSADLIAGQDRVAESLLEIETDSYATVDLRAGVAPLRGINLRVGVDNLFDEGYVNHLNSKNPFTGQQILEPGRIFYVDVSYGF